MSTTPWIRKLQILYVSTIGLWAVGFAFVVYAATQVGNWGGITNTAIMAIGPAYFVFESFRLARLDDETAHKSARRLFRFQRVLGIAVTVGGVVGLLPAYVNFLSVTEMEIHDQLNNAGMLVPWVLVYVYTVVFFVAEDIRRGLKVKKVPPVKVSDAKVPSEAPEAPAVQSTATEPAAAKTPIAPNLFFVLAILLGLFTVQVETTAFNMARSGELTDLQTPGFAFSFLQFIDLFASPIALAVLVFGLVNWSRDKGTLRKIGTPLVALIALIIPPGAAGMALAGITGVSPETAERNGNAQISSDWINNLIEAGFPEGFTELSDNYDCALDNCEDPDSGFTFIQFGGNESRAIDVCAIVIAYASNNGATAWAIAPDYIPIPLESAEDPAANEMCVTSLADYPELEHSYSIESAVFRLIGDGEIPFKMDLVEIDMGTADENPDAINYRFSIATTFTPDELLPGEDMLSDGSHELNDMLTAIGQARLKHPDVDPNDATLIEDALSTYPYDIPVNPLVDSDGKIRFVEIVTSDSDQPMCVSLAPWDENFEGMADPGTGYGVSSEESVAALRANPHFGAQAWGHCGE